MPLPGNHCHPSGAWVLQEGLGQPLPCPPAHMALGACEGLSAQVPRVPLCPKEKGVKQQTKSTTTGRGRNCRRKEKAVLLLYEQPGNHLAPVPLDGAEPQKLWGAEPLTRGTSQDSLCGEVRALQTGAPLTQQLHFTIRRGCKNVHLCYYNIEASWVPQNEGGSSPQSNRRELTDMRKARDICRSVGVGSIQRACATWSHMHGCVGNSGPIYT